MELTYKRKLPISRGNKAAVIAIPRAVAQSWEQYRTVDIVFDGNCLVITPNEGDKLAHGDQEA
jgi:hypothetical protein